MMLSLFALWPPSTIVDYAILIVIIAAIAGLVFIALREFKIEIPPWAVHAFWIVIVAVVIIFCIRLVAQM